MQISDGKEEECKSLKLKFLHVERAAVSGISHVEMNLRQDMAVNLIRQNNAHVVESWKNEIHAGM